MRPEQTVNEMSEAVLSRQARAMVAQTGQPFESALVAICSTEAGQQLRGTWQPVSIALRRPKIGR